jgi:DNA (cytosine-5)-methyltransferase 1
MRVVSLFCGIGGFDKGFMDEGYDVIWANDIDKYAVQTYEANYPGGVVHRGDINEIPLETIPEHDVLIAGFPCQPFSMMGNKQGFGDLRGNLFFRVEEIVRYQIENNKMPEVIVLENVRNLLLHNNKETFLTIKTKLENLGYSVYAQVLNSANYGVPQIRNRVFIVCFRDRGVQFGFPNSAPLKLSVRDILELQTDEKYYLSERMKATVLSKGTGRFVAKSEINQSPARPLCATMAKMHRACQDNYYSDDYIHDGGDKNRIRRLTPRECARLQGFDDSFIIPVSDSQAYKQFGNAVTVNVSRAIAREIRRSLIWE